MSSLYILEIKPLSVTSFANIFLPVHKFSFFFCLKHDCLLHLNPQRRASAIKQKSQFKKKFFLAYSQRLHPLNITVFYWLEASYLKGVRDYIRLWILGTAIIGGHLTACLPHFSPMSRILVIKDSGMIKLKYHIIYAFKILIDTKVTPNWLCQFTSHIPYPCQY